MGLMKREIMGFLNERKSYIREKLGFRAIKDCFYGEKTVEQVFSDKNIKYCKMYMYDIVYSEYNVGVKYVEGEETFYMFIGANTRYAMPERVAVGKAVDGIIYLLVEQLPDTFGCLTFREVPEKYINKNECGPRPKGYLNIVKAYEHTQLEKITDEDVNCFEIAYEGLVAFKELMAEAKK